MLRSTIILTILSLLSVLFNLIIQIILAYYFGTGIERDSFVLASTTPTYITTICVGSIGVTLIPLLVEKNKSTGNSINTILIILSIVSLFFSIIVFAFSDVITHILLHSNKTDILSSELLKILSPTIFLLNLNAILTSLYHSKQRFFLPGISSLIISITSLIFVILLNQKVGIKSLAYGQVMGSLLAFLIMLPIIKHQNLQINFRLTDPSFLLFLRNILPLLITGLLFKSYSIVERSYASSMEQGSISFLAYSSQIWSIAASISINSIVITSFPKISKLFIDNQVSILGENFRQIFRVILLLAFPIVFILYFFGTEIIQIVFERGVFTHRSTIFVYNAIVFSSLYFISQCLGAFLSRIFNIAKKNNLLFYISAFEFLVYICIASLKLFNNSFLGLSTALSISSLFNILISLILINNNIIQFRWKILFLESTKIIFVSFLSVFFVKYFVYPFLNFNEIVKLLVSFSIIITLGFIIAALLKIKEVYYLKTYINKLSWWKR